MAIKSENDTRMERAALDHAWSWFSLHATQRLQSVNFFLVAMAFLSAAFVTAVREELHPLGLGIALLAILISYFFYRMERRIRTLIHTAEDAMKPLQDNLAESLGVDALRLVSHVEEARLGEWKYSKVFRYLYWTTGGAFGFGFFYVTWAAVGSTPDPIMFKGVLEAALSVFLIVVGYEMLVSFPPVRLQYQNQHGTYWALIIFGGLCILSGITIIGHLIFFRL